VKTLRTVAKRLGVLCFVVIHQPRHEVAQLFDSLVLLTSGPGRMAYCGPMACAEGYFAERECSVPVNVNPTDHYLDLLTPGTRSDRADTLVAAFKALQQPGIDAQVGEALALHGPKAEEMLQAAGERVCNTPYSVGFCKQLATVLRRKVRLLMRNPMSLVLPLAVPILQGIITGFMFQGIGERGLLRQG